MTGTRRWDGGTPGFPPPGWDPSLISDTTLDALLSGTELPEDPAGGGRHAADIVAALKGRPAPDELAGEAMAMAEFRHRVSGSERARRSHRRRGRAGWLLSARGAAAAAAVAIASGGVVAAYAGVLPAPVQRVAHAWIGAPAPRIGSTRHGHAASAPAANQAVVHHPCSSASGRASAGFCSRSRHRPVRHWHSPGCPAAPSRSWPPGRHRSWSPGPHPSWSPGAHPARNSHCPRKPERAWPARPHRPHPTRPFRPRGRPTPRPTSPHPAWSPSRSPGYPKV